MQQGILFALQRTISTFPTVYLLLNNDTALVYNEHLINTLRISEVSSNFLSSSLDDGTVISTTIIFETKGESEQGALLVIIII